MGAMNGFAGNKMDASAILDTRIGGYVLAGGAAVLYPIVRVLLDRYVFMVRPLHKTSRPHHFRHLIEECLKPARLCFLIWPHSWLTIMLMQPLGRASFFPSQTELKKADAKADYEDLNSRLFKYKGELINALNRFTHCHKKI